MWPFQSMGAGSLGISILWLTCGLLICYYIRFLTFTARSVSRLVRLTPLHRPQSQNVSQWLKSSCFDLSWNCLFIHGYIAQNCTNQVYPFVAVVVTTSTASAAAGAAAAPVLYCIAITAAALYCTGATATAPLFPLYCIADTTTAAPASVPMQLLLLLLLLLYIVLLLLLFIFFFLQLLFVLMSTILLLVLLLYLVLLLQP